jgi:hypothetical protein
VQLKNTTGREDKEISAIEEFGSLVERVLMIIEKLDDKLTEALDKVSNMETDIERLEDELEEYRKAEA